MTQLELLQAAREHRYTGKFEGYSDAHMTEMVDDKHSKGLIAISSCGMMYE